MAGNVAQGNAGIVHDDGRIISVHTAAQHSGCPLLESGIHKIVAVPQRLQRNEQLTGLQGSCIIGRAVKGHVRVFFFNTSAAPPGSLTQCDSSHKCYLISARWAATTSLSSRWCLTPMIS